MSYDENKEICTEFLKLLTLYYVTNKMNLTSKTVRILLETVLLFANQTRIPEASGVGGQVAKILCTQTDVTVLREAITAMDQINREALRQFIMPAAAQGEQPSTETAQQQMAASQPPGEQFKAAGSIKLKLFGKKNA